MPRPKLTKINPSRPASRRVAQRTPSNPADSNRSNPVREASSRVEDNSDDSDGLVTSLSRGRKRKLRPQLNDGTVMMSGGLGIGDIKGAHIRAGSAIGRPERVGHAKAIEGLKMRKDAWIEGRQPGTTDGDKAPGNSIDSAEEGSKVALDALEVEGSVLDVANFKRRARQPSILRDAAESQQDVEDGDVFEPGDESTPLKFSTSAPLLPQDPDYTSSSSLSLPRSNPRKRKLTSPPMDMPPSSPPIAFDLASAASRPDGPSSPPTFLEARDRRRVADFLDGRKLNTTLHMPSEVAAPPRSSSPAMQSADIAPGRVSSPGHQGTSGRPTKRQRQHLPRKKQVGQTGQEGVSDVEDLRSEDEDPADAEILARSSRRKGGRKKIAPISTATLQSLLPRRRRRARPDGFDIMGSSDIDAETTRPNNEPSPIRATKSVKKRQSVPESKRSGLGKVAPHGRKDTPGKKGVATTQTPKAPRTYGRRISSDKENDGLSTSPTEEGDSLAPVDSNESTPSHENAKRMKGVLKQASRKFKDVDNWELDFEEVTATRDMAQFYNPLSLLPSLNPIALFRMTGFVNFKSFSLSSTPPLDGKVAVITGGQAGIGKEISAQLLLHGISKVYIIARNRSRYLEAKNYWHKSKGLTMDDIERRTEFLACDLGDIKSVGRVGHELLEKLQRLDILINNAALPTVPEYTLSVQGIETIFAVNHVGHFALTNILLPLIESTATAHGDARIIVTSSSLHMGCHEIDFATLTSPTRTRRFAGIDSTYRYARSKLANILFARELTHRLEESGMPNVYTNVYFPGNIPTEAMDTWNELFGVAGNLVKGAFRFIGQSTTEGAATAIFLAASPEVERRQLRGKYFIPIATEDKTSKIAEDMDVARELWEWTDAKVTETLGRNWQRNGVAEATA
ncbi:MAG: hypothetical protein M1839_007023 [Geoglossum umbratile]|nr:MAG: hypothetical protein M1839_007023 [Geoglossum umbratile]